MGLLGLVEFEWLETLNMISLDELDYEDYVEVANILVKELQDANCDIIIALTHMREPNDIRLGTTSSEHFSSYYMACIVRLKQFR